MKTRPLAVFAFLISITLLSLLGLSGVLPPATKAQPAAPDLLIGPPERPKYITTDAQNVEFVGHIGGVTRSVFVQGRYAYIDEGPRLTILDISNPASPAVVGKMTPLPNGVGDFYVSGSTAYVVSGGVLRAVDVSNPASPTEVGFYNIPGGEVPNTGVHVYVSGDLAYVVNRQGLYVVDVSNPASPIEVGFYNKRWGASYVYVSGGYAYVGDGGALRVVDVSNPASPVEVGYYDTHGDARGVSVSEGYAYVADGDIGLRVVDVSNPASPVEVGYVDTPGSARGVSVSGGYAYIADWYDGLRVVDVSNPASPTEVGYYDTPGEAWDVYVSGAMAYVADYDGGLRVVDVSNPASPVEAGYYDTPGDAWGVSVSGDYAYVADLNAGLRVVDVSNPANPSEVGYYDPLGYVHDVFVSGGYAYVAGYSGLRVVNVSNPASPVEVGYYYTSRAAWDVYVSGGYAYVVYGDSGLRVVDVSNPASPTEVGYYDTPGRAVDVYVSGGYAYVADGDSGLRVVDVSNPASPTEVGYYDTPGRAVDVYVSGGYAYVADRDSGLWVVDVSNSASPTEVGYYDTSGSALDVYVSGGHAYVADYWGLRVVDVSNPASPVEVGYYDTPGGADSVSVSGGYAYVANGHSGLLILRYRDEKPPDVFISDNITDTGTLPSVYPWYKSDYIWVRHAPDWQRFSLAVDLEQTNYIYIRVQNLGDVALEDVEVAVYCAAPAHAPFWPDDWHYIGSTHVSGMAMRGEKTVYIPWNVSGICRQIAARDHLCLLVRLITDQDPIQHEGSVPWDNNIGQRNVHIIPPENRSGLSNQNSVLAAVSENITFLIGNPLTTTQTVDLEFGRHDFPTNGQLEIYLAETLFDQWQSAGGAVEGGLVDLAQKKIEITATTIGVIRGLPLAARQQVSTTMRVTAASDQLFSIAVSELIAGEYVGGNLYTTPYASHAEWLELSATVEGMVPDSTQPITATVFGPGKMPVKDGTMVNFSTTPGAVISNSVTTVGGIATTQLRALGTTGAISVSATADGVTAKPLEIAVTNLLYLPLIVKDAR